MIQNKFSIKFSVMKIDIKGVDVSGLFLTNVSVESE